MPRFIYQGEGDRYYPSLALTPAPGTSYDLDADPGDGRWAPAVDTGSWTSQIAVEPAPATAPIEESAPAPHDTTGGE
ncbi:hypothetical protein ACPC54_17955 [Kitasatospora sp. NPDC094028]